MSKKDELKSGIELIADERNVQIEKLHFTPEKDDNLNKGQLLNLAMYCILSNNDYLPKDTWSIDYLKSLHKKPRIEQLTIAGALIAAEIDRRLRLRVGLSDEEEKDLIRLTEMRTDPNKNMTQDEFEYWHKLRMKKYGEY